MSTAARIDELRKKFEENPRRYFAPLANELRKAGSLSEAIALCREFLPKQPEHMSGYIVFGQSLYESGDLSEARIVFEQALALDPENLKALRHLGDIAKWEGDTAGARRWYERVLEADPRNDDIAAQLATLVTPVYVKAVEPTPEVPAPSSYTPAFSMAPIGLGAIPTPDAALRAVDFDEINARLREPEADRAESTGIAHLSVDPRALHAPDLLDLDAIEAAGEAVDANVDASLSEAMPEGIAAVHAALTENAEDEIGAAADDPFGFSEVTAGASLEDVPFEEGLIAPDWPDTSELEARATTPRSVTPLVVAPMTADAVAAFGVEPGDPITNPALDEDAFPADIEAQLASAAERTMDIAATFDRRAEPEAENDVAEPAFPDSSEPVNDLGEQPVAETAVETFDAIDETAPDWLAAAPEVSAPLLDDELPWLAPSPDRESEGDIGVEGAADVDVDAGDASFADVMPEEQNAAFLTETMGELLVSQGFTARAVTVYEELVRRRPYDPVLTSRLAELQECVAGEAAMVAPAFLTPAVAGPAFVSRVTPPFTTPLSVTPRLSAAVEESIFSEAQAERVTARERFAQLAIRRVPRRTPPRASVAVETPSDGLASLFGGATPAHDDLAARALAEAFSPIDESIHFGGELPFEEAMLGGALQSPTPMRSATPIATAAVADAPGGPFSFDRFFPDPATAGSPLHTPSHSPSNTPAIAPARDVAPPTVSDDLAQFSAWLKGLGNS